MANVSGSATKNEPQWLVMLYVNAADSLIYNDAEEYVRNLASAASVAKGSVCIWVQWRIRPSGSASRVERFRLSSNTDPSNPAVSKITDDFGSADGIAQFVNFCREEHPYAKTLFIFHSHGSGTLGLSSTTALLRLKKWVAELLGARDDGDWDLISFATTSVRPGQSKVSSSLTLANIGNGLLPTGDTRKLDIVMFSACFMALIETVYQLRDACDYVVGGEGLVYTSLTMELFETLSRTPKPIDAANLLVRNYENVIVNRSTATDDHAFSAICVARIDRVVNAIRELVCATLESAPADQTSALKALKAAKDWAGTFNDNGRHVQFGVDIIFFMERFSAFAKTERLRKAALDVVSAAAHAIVARTAGDDDASLRGAHGIAFYCPLGLTKPPVTYRYYIEEGNIDFVSATQWDKILEIAFHP